MMKFSNCFFILQFMYGGMLRNVDAKNRKTETCEIYSSRCNGNLCQDNTDGYRCDCNFPYRRSKDSRYCIRHFALYWVVDNVKYCCVPNSNSVTTGTPVIYTKGEDCCLMQYHAHREYRKCTAASLGQGELCLSSNKGEGDQGYEEKNIILKRDCGKYTFRYQFRRIDGARVKKMILNEGSGKYCVSPQQTPSQTRPVGYNVFRNCNEVTVGYSEELCYTDDDKYKFHYVKSQPVANCSHNNGGCHLNATCGYDMNDTINCTCQHGFFGNGILCSRTPVNGNWGNWSFILIEQCDRSCRRGRLKIGRTCDNPKPQNGGKLCQQRSTNIRALTETFYDKCNQYIACPTPVNGNWGRWSIIEQCDRSCGGGRLKMGRTCDNPKPQNGGKLCLQRSTNIRALTETFYDKCNQYIACPTSDLIDDPGAVAGITAGIAVGIAVGICLLIGTIIILIYRHHMKRKYSAYLSPTNVEIDRELSLLEQIDNLGYNTAFEFPRNKVELTRLLGAGAFGEVWLADVRGMKAFQPRHDEQLSRRYYEFAMSQGENIALIEELGRRTDAKSNVDVVKIAVKTLKENASDEDLKDLSREIKILIHLGTHPIVINLLGACTRGKGNKLYALLEYCEHGSLQSFLRSKKRTFDPNIDEITGYFCGESVTHFDLLTLIIQIIRGMVFLHSNKLIHRDLATRNILVAENYTMKVADFGRARTQTEYVQQSDALVPVKWMAPEALLAKTYTNKTDIWSFGILLWEVYSFGNTPYPGLSHIDLAGYLKAGRRMEIPDGCLDSVYEVMKECWEYEAEQRPCFVDLIKELEMINQKIRIDKFDEYYPGFHQEGEKDDDSDGSNTQDDIPYLNHDSPNNNINLPIPPVPVEEKCVITAYNTPVDADFLPEITKIIEEHGYEIQKVHHVELRPGVKSGVRKYLVTFEPDRNPIRLPEMVELYGRNIGFDQTRNDKISDRSPLDVVEVSVKPVEATNILVPEMDVQETPKQAIPPEAAKCSHCTIS